jgi:hypothetical protein
VFKKRQKEAYAGELEWLREISKLRFSYTVAGQVILGPVSFRDLSIMLRYGYPDQDMRITEEIARGVMVEHRIWNKRYESVTRKPPEKP